MQTINKLKDIYRVWYAYLIYCPEFQKYIHLVHHKGTLLENLPPKIAEISGYHDWIYSLLPLNGNYPCMNEFTHVWRRFQRCYTARNIHWQGSELNTNIIQDIVDDLEKHLPSILDDFKSKNNTEETVGQILHRISSEAMGGPVIQIPRPAVYPKRESIEKIKHFLEPYPDLKEPQMGAWLSDNDPIRFKNPTTDHDSGRRIDDLNTYKRDLTWYVLLKTGASHADLFYGNAIELYEDHLPFQDEGINFTGHNFEKEISIRLKTGKTITPEMIHKEYKHSARNRKERTKIKQFTEWAQHCKDNAEKTMKAVSQGWFPKIPIER